MEKKCCQKCLGSYGFGKDNWGCIEKGCYCHKPTPTPQDWEESIKIAIVDYTLALHRMTWEGINEFGSRNPDFDKMMNTAGDKIDLILNVFSQELDKREASAREDERRVVVREIGEKIGQIVLLPTEEDSRNLKSLPEEGIAEWGGFGYGQIWMLNKILAITQSYLPLTKGKI